VWKWLAVFLAGIVLSGATLGVRVITLPDRADYSRVDDRSLQNQVQIARLQEQLLGQVAANTVQINNLEASINALREQLNTQK
jgi:hypothetical protein